MTTARRSRGIHGGSPALSPGGVPTSRRLGPARARGRAPRDRRRARPSRGPAGSSRERIGRHVPPPATPSLPCRHARRGARQDRPPDRDAEQARATARSSRQATAVGRREHPGARGVRRAPLEENDRLGRGHLNAGRYFPAHEAWETAWKQARDTPTRSSTRACPARRRLRAPDAGNAHGAAKLLRRGAGRVRGYPEGHRGVDTTRVAAAAEALADAVEQGRVTPGDDAAFETTGHLTSSVKVDCLASQGPPWVHGRTSRCRSARMEGPHGSPSSSRWTRPYSRPRTPAGRSRMRSRSSPATS